MSFVFVSYSTKDSRMATRVRNAIAESGTNIWMAPNSIAPGEDYTDALSRALKNCDLVLLLLSPDSNASRYVHREIERAVSYGKRVVPLMLTPFEPRGGLEFLISGAQRIDGTASDPEAWLPDVIHVAQTGGDAEQLPLKRRKSFVQIRPPVAAGALLGGLGFTSLILNAVPSVGVDLPDAVTAAANALPGPGAMALAISILIGAVALGRNIASSKDRKFVLRWSDIIMFAALGGGVLLLAKVFLFTPLIAALVAGGIYVIFRNALIHRWGALSVAAVLSLIGAIWFAEGQLYHRYFDRGPAIAVVPYCDLNGCSDTDEALYRGLVDELNDAFLDADPDVLPSRRSVQLFYDRAESFVDRPRAAMFANLMAHQQVFDSIVSVTLNPVNCGSEQIRFSAKAYEVRRGRAPSWSYWETGRKKQLGEVNTFEGFMPAKDAQAASLLLAGLILFYVAELDASEDEQAQDMILQYLRSANEDNNRQYISDTSKAAIASALQPTAQPEAVQAAFVEVIESMRGYADDVADPERCDDAQSDAITQYLMRNSLIGREES